MAADDVLVVNGGREMTVDALLALGASAPEYIQQGVGTTATDPAQTDLIDKTDCGEARVQGTDAKVSNYTYRTVGTITKADADAIIREVATFNGAGTGSPPSGDTMFLRAMFDAISIKIGNSIEYTIDTLISAT